MWGLGHTITLLIICGILLIFGETLSPTTESLLEFLVGIMLILLGLHVVASLREKKSHFHMHKHQDGVTHMHAHSHENYKEPHAKSVHEHRHINMGLSRALLVGMIHGAAGSAGMLVLAATAQTLANALGFIIAFGAGSIVGMTTLSFLASYPLRTIENGARWLQLAVTASIGALAITVGVMRLVENWPTI
tara:strand:- start:113 stop:685 length:573 start_codon:yes stop_codon:yes gene_type:complete